MLYTWNLYNTVHELCLNIQQKKITSRDIIAMNWLHSWKKIWEDNQEN